MSKCDASQLLVHGSTRLGFLEEGVSTFSRAIDQGIMASAAIANKGFRKGYAFVVLVSLHILAITAYHIVKPRPVYPRWSFCRQVIKICTKGMSSRY